VPILGLVIGEIIGALGVGDVRVGFEIGDI
jgi:hypothetical protein